MTFLYVFIMDFDDDSKKESPPTSIDLAEVMDFDHKLQEGVRRHKRTPETDGAGPSDWPLCKCNFARYLANIAFFTNK